MTLERPMFPPVNSLRRGFVAQAAGVAAGGAALGMALPLPSPAATPQGVPDPILAAIEAHKAARAVFEANVHRHGALEKELPHDKCRSSCNIYEERIVETDDPRWINCERELIRTMHAVDDVAVVLVSICPTTMAGIVALLEYALSADIDGDGWPTELESDDGKIRRPWHYFLVESLAGALTGMVSA